VRNFSAKIAAVDAAKGRVMRRLIQRIREMERDFPDDTEEP
jgi:hypothetical protein